MAMKNQKGSDPVPIDQALLDWAEYWYPISWKGILIGGVITAVGACATIAFLLLQWRTINIREEHSEWRTSTLELQTAEAKRDTTAAQERIAGLNNETEQLKADNLSLQTALLPRHVGLIGLDGPPKALEWFSGIEAFSGTEISIQVVPDAEAQNLANEIAIVLSKFGWRPQFIDEKRSHFSSSRISDGINASYPVGKPWTADEPNQPWFAWNSAAEALANALTKARLGIGEAPVSRYGFLNNDPHALVGTAPSFDPPLTGVYLQIGSRPVAATVEWIRHGRPDEMGNLPPSATPEQNIQK
jgi:hypothetical protein